MDKQKQIAELANDINISYHKNCHGRCMACEYEATNSENHSCVDIALATNLIEIGYHKQSAWISIDERLPESDGKYLVCTQRQKIHISTFYGGAFCCFSDESRVVTHWMALPELPKNGERKDQNG